MVDETNNQTETNQTENKETETKKEEVKLNTYNVDESNKKLDKSIQDVENILGNKVMTLADKIDAAKNKLSESSNIFNETNSVKTEFTSAIEESLNHAYNKRGKFDVDLFFKKFDEINKTVMPENNPLPDYVESKLIYDVEKK